MGKMDLTPEVLHEVVLRNPSNGPRAKTTITISIELMERLDRFQKQRAAGLWRRGTARTKGQIIEDALRSYLDQQETATS